MGFFKKNWETAGKYIKSSRERLLKMYRSNKIMFGQKEKVSAKTGKTDRRFYPEGIKSSTQQRYYKRLINLLLHTLNYPTTT